jgi:hypothetical protein
LRSNREQLPKSPPIPGLPQRVANLGEHPFSRDQSLLCFSAELNGRGRKPVARIQQCQKVNRIAKRPLSPFWRAAQIMILLLRQVLGQALGASGNLQQAFPHRFSRTLQKLMHSAVHFVQFLAAQLWQFSNDLSRAHPIGSLPSTADSNKFTLSSLQDRKKILMSLNKHSENKFVFYIDIL